MGAHPLHRIAPGLAGLVAAAFGVALLGGCATNPATGRPQLVLVSESSEIAMGREYAPQIESAMGVYEDEALGRYVESVGLPMARASERPGLPWQFRVIDDAAVNAFAVPGGFIFVTRGILASMSSEAELASVLGHEIGHVTARHTVNQLSKQQLAQIGLVAGAIALGSEGQQLVSLAGQGLGLLFLKYGRDDERESDDLGLRYMTAAGYDPEQMVEVFRTLGRASATRGSERVPEWLSTHPNPENREARIEQAIARLGAPTAPLRVERAAFLRHVDGVVYGPDPRAGFFAGSRFHHPGLRFRLDFPEGWQTANQPQAVLALSPERNALLQVSVVGNASAADAAQAFFAQQGLNGRDRQSGPVNGLPSAGGGFSATTDQGPLAGRVAFVEYGGAVYRLLGYGSEQGFTNHERAVATSLASFARETDARVLGVEPWRIRIVTPSRSLSAEAFARTYPGPVGAEELARLNQLDPGEGYAAGVPVKSVRGDPLPGGGR